MIAAVAISDDDENCGETVPFGERSDGQKGGWQTDEQSDLSGLRLGRMKDKQGLFIFQKLLLATTQKAREYRAALLLVVNEK